MESGNDLGRSCCSFWADLYAAKTNLRTNAGTLLDELSVIFDWLVKDTRDDLIPDAADCQKASLES